MREHDKGAICVFTIWPDLVRSQFSQHIMDPWLQMICNGPVTDIPLYLCINFAQPLLINPYSAKKKMHLKMSSADVVCCKWLPIITDELCIEANSVDPE